MKKLLFAAVSLDVGGIETALVTLLNYLAQNKKYDIVVYNLLNCYIILYRHTR